MDLLCRLATFSNEEELETVECLVPNLSRCSHRRLFRLDLCRQTGYFAPDYPFSVGGDLDPDGWSEGR